MNRRSFLGKFSKLSACLPFLPVLTTDKSETNMVNDNASDFAEEFSKGFKQGSSNGFRPLVSDPNNIVADAYYDVDRKNLTIYWHKHNYTDIKIMFIPRPNNGYIELRFPELEPILIHMGMETGVINIVSHTVDTLM